MAADIDPFREWLRTSGYTPDSSRGLLKVMGQLGRWMQTNVTDGEQLTVADLEAFADSLRSRAAGRAPRLGRNDPLRKYLVEAGVVRLPVPVLSGEVEVLIDGFRRWMIDERGLAAGTVLRYENAARRFLTERYKVCGPAFITSLTARDVVGFLVVECGRVSGRFESEGGVIVG